VRVFPPHEANAEKPYVLALFSSTATLAAYLADSPVREFDLRRGTSLEPFLRANLSSLERVYFDPAGPHPMQASPEDFLWSLQPTPSDDEVAWSAGEVAAPVQDELRTVGMDVPLSREWFVITLNDEPKRNREIDELVSRQLKTIGAAPVLRQELAKWLRASCARAASAGGRFQAYLLQRNEKTALALSLTMYWQDLGPALGDGHLDAMTRKKFVRHLKTEIALTPEGERFVANKLQIDVADIAHARRPLCKACLDWSERRHHLAGTLGAAMLARFTELKWAARDSAAGSRVVNFTRTGEKQFAALFGSGEKSKT